MSLGPWEKSRFYSWEWRPWNWLFGHDYDYGTLGLHAMEVNGYYETHYYHLGPLTIELQKRRYYT